MDTRKPITWEQIFCFFIAICILIFFGYIVIMSYVTRYSLPTEAGQIMACLISVLSGIVGYMIGSNAQSKTKDELIGKAMDSVPADHVKSMNVPTANETTGNGGSI